MIATLLVTVLASTAVLSDTMVRLGIVERDLTGDNVPEILSLTGRGQTVDSLEVTFTITSSGRTVFETKRSEEHTSELQSRFDIVCRLLLEKKKKLRTPEGYARVTAMLPTFYVDLCQLATASA